MVSPIMDGSSHSNEWNEDIPQSWTWPEAHLQGDLDFVKLAINTNCHKVVWINPKKEFHLDKSISIV